MHLASRLRGPRVRVERGHGGGGKDGIKDAHAVAKDLAVAEAAIVIEAGVAARARREATHVDLGRVSRG
jgi:hypothetical protein